MGAMMLGRFVPEAKVYAHYAYVFCWYGRKRSRSRLWNVRVTIKARQVCMLLIFSQDKVIGPSRGREAFSNTYRNGIMSELTSPKNMGNDSFAKEAPSAYTRYVIRSLQMLVVLTPRTLSLQHQDVRVLCPPSKWCLN